MIVYAYVSKKFKRSNLITGSCWYNYVHVVSLSYYWSSLSWLVHTV